MSNMFMKGDLTERELTLVHSEVESKKKNPVAAWLLWLFTGGIGGHRYYLGNIGMGTGMTLTLGGFGFWALIDAFFINARLREIEEKAEEQAIYKVKAMR